MKQHRRNRRGEKSSVHDRKQTVAPCERATGPETGLRGAGRVGDPAASPETVVKELEARIRQLEDELRLERVRGAVDLRVAAGLVREADREVAIADMMDATRWPDAAIVMLREDYRKMINRLVRRRSGEPAPAPPSRGERYVI